MDVSCEDLETRRGEKEVIWEEKGGVSQTVFKWSVQLSLVAFFSDENTEVTQANYNPLKAKNKRPTA